MHHHQRFYTLDLLISHNRNFPSFVKPIGLDLVALRVSTLIW